MWETYKLKNFWYNNIFINLIFYDDYVTLLKICTPIYINNYFFDIFFL